MAGWGHIRICSIIIWRPCHLVGQVNLLQYNIRSQLKCFTFPWEQLGCCRTCSVISNSILSLYYSPTESSMLQQSCTSELSICLAVLKEQINNSWNKGIRLSSLPLLWQRLPCCTKSSYRNNSKKRFSYSCCPFSDCSSWVAGKFLAIMIKVVIAKARALVPCCIPALFPGRFTWPCGIVCDHAPLVYMLIFQQWMNKAHVLNRETIGISMSNLK